MHLTTEQYQRLRRATPDRPEPPLWWRPAVVVTLVEGPLVFGSIAIAVIHVPPPAAFAAVVILGVLNAVAVMTIGHDGQHRQWFRSEWLSALAVQVSAFGISRQWWAVKHNHFHHSGSPGSRHYEPPLDLGRFARLAPEQPWRRWHSAQHVYFWPVLLTQHTAMILQSTVFNCTGRFRGQQHAAPGVSAAAGRLAEQWAFPGSLIALGAWRHGWAQALIATLILTSVIGLVTALVLVVEIRTRALASTCEAEAGRGWLAYQLNASMTVSRSSRLVTWLTGALNLHTAHHLFPSLPSYRMRDVDEALHQLAVTEGLSVIDFATYRSSWRSFASFLRELGRCPPPEPAPETQRCRMG